MNGPEHYRKAEELVDELLRRETQGLPPHAEVLMARAQVHATLALAAALGTLDSPSTAINTMARTSRDAWEWDRVTYDTRGGHR